MQKQYTKANEWFNRYVTLEKENTVLLTDAYNRIGDGFYQARNFTKALEAYSNNFAKGGTTAGVDYAIYQTAFVYGLQGKYTDKIVALEDLIKKFPKSYWADDASYEIGCSYVALNNNAKAISTFKNICSKYPKNSDIVRLSRAQLAMLQYNEGLIDEAIATHKLIIAQYPNSEEAEVSLSTLESMMVEQNRVDEFNKLAQQLGKSSASQEDSLQYKAVEKIYFRDELPAAVAGFDKYLKAYPQGKYRSLATYYLANCYYRQNQYDTALDLYAQLVNDTQNPNLEETLVRAASLSYDAKKYEQAATYFDQLSEVGSAEHRQAAALGLLRCWNLLSQYEKTIDAANDLIQRYAGNADMVAEARYNRMKAYMALNKVDNAFGDIKTLADDTRSEYGAEAKYYKAQYYLDKNELAKAEEEVFDYIDKGTSHQHWLAMAFVTLSDVYMAQEKYFEAKQYLLSLRENYDTSDDAEVANMIEARLKKIESYENESVSNN
jgi:TolA-binding protein